MKIELAKHAGFCFGVKRAMDIVINTAEGCKQKVYTLGPLIHNDQVVSRLREKGVFELKGIEEVVPNTSVIIRTHGVPKKFYDTLENMNCTIIDVTCPFVKKNTQNCF